MISQDITMLNSESLSYIEYLEMRVAFLESQLNINNQDWDNSTLMREWKICERTAAYYRSQGLSYYKRGGRIYYTPEARERFQKQINNSFFNQKS